MNLTARYDVPMADDVPTRIQLELLALYAAGLTFRDIGERTFMSGANVKYHLDRLRKTVDAPNLPNAMVQCVARGYLCIDGRACEVFVPSDLPTDSVLVRAA